MGSLPRRSVLVAGLVLRPPKHPEWGIGSWRAHVAGEDREDLGVGSVEELDGMGEGAVLTALVDLEEPDDGRQQDDG